MKRFYHIDFLRAVCILGFIAIHVFSYHLNNSLNNAIWNYLHFVVGGFVFCSGYVLAKYEKQLTSWLHISAWYHKRILRLLKPYYWFVLIYCLLLLMIPQFLSGIGMQLSFSYIAKSLIFFEGGSNFSWLPLLFLELTLLFPVLLEIMKNKTYTKLYIGFCLLVTLYFSAVVFPYDLYRWAMWIPWSLILMLGIWFYERERKHFGISDYLKYFIISGLVFGLCYLLWSLFGKPLNLIDNKYPPNFYDLSFELFGTMGILIISDLKFISVEWFRKLYSYLSEQSYFIFFIHIIVLDFFVTLNKKHLFNVGPWAEFSVVLLSALVINYLLQEGIRLAQNYKKK